MNKRLKILLNNSIIIFSFSTSIKIYYFDLDLSLNLIWVDNFDVLFIINCIIKNIFKYKSFL